MKRLIFIWICLSFVPQIWADDLKIKGVIKPDPLRGGDNYLILNRDGNQKGLIRPDPLWPELSDRYLILDKDGDEAGIIRPDPIRGKGHWIIETKK